MLNDQFTLEGKIQKGSILKVKTKKNKNFGSFNANLTLKIKVKVTNFKIIQDIKMINKKFKFEDKILNDSKVVALIRNHTDDDNATATYDADGTKNNVSPSWGETLFNQ